MAWSKDDDFMINRVDLIVPTTVEGALYGFTFALYIFCARSLYLQLKDQDRRKQRLFTLVYMSILMALAFCNLAVDTQGAQTSYADHADYPGGGHGYTVDVFGGSSVAIVGYVAYTLVGFMTSAIQIWRLWIIWKTKRYSSFIVILLVLCLLAYLGLEIAAIMAHVQGLRPEKNALNDVIYYGTTGFPLFISVTVTLLIIGRIIAVRRDHIKFMGQADSSGLYTSVTSMLIESFALESAWIIGAMCGYFYTSNAALYAVDTFFEDTQPFIQVLAYLLVIHRVATRRGWEDTSEKLTTLRWDQGEVQTIQIGTRVPIPITCEGV